MGPSLDGGPHLQGPQKEALAKDLLQEQWGAHTPSRTLSCVTSGAPRLPGITWSSGSTVPWPPPSSRLYPGLWDPWLDSRLEGTPRACTHVTVSSASPAQASIPVAGCRSPPREGPGLWSLESTK